MAKMPPLMIKPVMPVSLMELIAIPLRNQKKIAKWLVIPQAGEGANESLREFHVNGAA